MSSPAMGKFKQLTKQVSRSIIRTDPDVLLPEEKLSLTDSKIDLESEFTWNVKVKSTDGSMKLDRTLVVGPNGCRLHLPISLDVIDDVPYTRMKEFSYNAEHHVFQITWQQTGTNTMEIIHFHTKHCVEIHETIQKFLKDILRSKKTGDPDAIMARCTYLRPVNLTELKKGGRLRAEIPPEELEAPSPPSPLSPKSPSRSRNAPTRSLSVQPTHHNVTKKEEGTDQRPRKKDEKEKLANQKTPRTPKSPSSQVSPRSQATPRSPKSTPRSPKSTPKSPRNRKPNNNTESDGDRKSHHTKIISSPRGTPRKKEKETQEIQEIQEITKDSDSSSSSEEKPAKKQVQRDTNPNITYKLSRDRDIEKMKSPKRVKSPAKLIDIGEENSE